MRQAAQIKNSQFNFKIEEEIKEIIDILSTLEPSEGSQLSYKAMRVDDKILPDSGPAFKIKVKAQVAYFYTEIKIIPTTRSTSSKHIRNNIQRS